MMMNAQKMIMERKQQLNIAVSEHYLYNNNNMVNLIIYMQ